MFQWLKRDFESEAVPAWLQIGPDFDDEAAARAYASEIVDVSPGDELILVHAIARARIGLVVEPFGMASAQPAAAPAGKRERKLRAVAAPAVEAPADTTTTVVQAPATVHEATGGAFVVDGEEQDRAPLPAPLPDPPADDGAAELAAHVAPAPDPDKPWVTLDGVKVRLFDGAQKWWQNFATEAAAEKSARKAAELIDEGAPAARFSAITIAMRKGDAPAE